MILQTGKLKLPNKESSGFTPLEKLKYKNQGTFLTGFTLIELLLVVAIILILAGMNIPALSKQFSRLKLENCALNILSICRYARQSAISQSRVYRLNFDLNEKSYWLSREPDTSGEFKNISGRLGRRFKVPSDISIDVSEQEIDFYPNGEYDAIEIILTNHNNLRCRLARSGAFDELEIKQEKQ